MQSARITLRIGCVGLETAGPCLIQISRMMSGTLRALGWRALLLSGCIALALAICTLRISSVASAERAEPPPPSAYAGDAACAQCHRKEAEFYGSTPHAKDSAEADAHTIIGSFRPQHNVLRTANPNLIIAMTAESNGFYQSGINITDPNNPKGEAERFDIVVGSGRHGQTYLYWDSDLLYELPVSYSTWSHEWAMSPSFPADTVHFDRPIVPRCLECHASYFKWLNPPANRFAKDSLVLGIGCERCHGPGVLHVERERSAAPPPHGSDQEAIVNPASLSHARQMDLCSLCHAGAVTPIGAPLRFVAGDDIRDYLKIPPPDPSAPVDVHGNQVGALEQSKCFGSGKLTCSTCHDVHRVQEDADSFSSRCQTCHKMQACGTYKKLGAYIQTRCVECHMPLQDSAKITFSEGKNMLRAELRAHRIAIYPDAAEKVEHRLQGR
jgi:hypothetical protein